MRADWWTRREEVLDSFRLLSVHQSVYITNRSKCLLWAYAAIWLCCGPAWMRQLCLCEFDESLQDFLRVIAKLSLERGGGRKFELHQKVCRLDKLIDWRMKREFWLEYFSKRDQNCISCMDEWDASLSVHILLLHHYRSDLSHTSDRCSSVI